MMEIINQLSSEEFIFYQTILLTGGGDSNSITEIVIRLVLQIAVILLAAKIGGEICERFLKQPGVLGELVMGMLIGPYALGILPIPGFGPLFPLPLADTLSGQVSFIPVSNELYALAQIAVVILLFVAGLETDLKQFLRYGGGASLIAIGGVVFPFILGSWLAVLFGVANSIGDPSALFVGAIMTATSVGITARVLSDIRKLDTPEGVTILAGAVIDDVLGILVLAIVVSLASTGSVSGAEIGIVFGKALGFWLALTGVGIILSPWISKVISLFKVEGAKIGLALALAFFCAALAEMFGLAMIIGAYSIGLALSSTKLAKILREPLEAVYYALVPIFFVVMGMLVDFGAMGQVIWFGIALSLIAVISKIIGCGIPSLAVGFNRKGALRIGIGMMPRGEVALIVAGVGLTNGIIGPDVFGVVIMMTIVTTLLAPIALVPIFNSPGSGLRKNKSQ